MNPIIERYFLRLKENSAGNGLKYFIYERNNERDLPYSVHFRFISKDGYTKDSWGTGKSKDEAFGKALMEMIERIFFCYFSPFSFYKSSFLKKEVSLFNISADFEIPIKLIHPASTNGVAIHLSKSKAIQAAKLELIERHTILYALAKGIGPKFKQQIKVSENKTADFFIYPGPCKTFTAIAALTENEGSFFGSGCGLSLDEAILKARLELNSFIYLKDDEQIEDSRIIENDIQSFNRYHKYSGDLSAVGFFKNAEFQKLPELDEDKFFFTFIPNPPLFRDLNDLKCARVIHPDAQQLFFDHWNFKHLNPRIFSEKDKLPIFPHIIA
jgi:hypothetical protein